MIDLNELKKMSVDLALNFNNIYDNSRRFLKKLKNPSKLKKTINSKSYLNNTKDVQHIRNQKKKINSINKKLSSSNWYQIET